MPALQVHIRQIMLIPPYVRTEKEKNVQMRRQVDNFQWQPPTVIFIYRRVSKFETLKRFFPPFNAKRNCLRKKISC